MSARHLYVHLPFCSHRCGYCDFVTVTGHDGEHGGYVDALLAELQLERGHLAGDVDTVFLGGGTPTFTEPAALARLLSGLPAAMEKRPPYDVAAAKRLLAEAGYPNGFGFTITCPNNRYINDEKICTAIAAMWARAGLDVKVEAKTKLPTLPFRTSKRWRRKSAPAFTVCRPWVQLRFSAH